MQNSYGISMYAPPKDRQSFRVLQYVKGNYTWSVNQYKPFTHGKKHDSFKCKHQVKIIRADILELGKICYQSLSQMENSWYLSKVESNRILYNQTVNDNSS